jgi:DNA adenine methylase
MKKHDCLFYLDPPYFLEGARSSLYGDEGDMHEYFPHLALFSTLRERENWILSYNDCAEIRQLYRDYLIHEVSWAYGMNKSKKSSEIIITNLPKRMHCVTIDLKGETNGEKSQDEN